MSIPYNYIKQKKIWGSQDLIFYLRSIIDIAEIEFAAFRSRVDTKGTFSISRITKLIQK
jgi:hypothetical protein